MDRSQPGTDVVEDRQQMLHLQQQRQMQNIHQMDWNCSFVAPFSWMLAGPSGSGKTQVIVEFVKKIARLMIPPAKRLVIGYNTYQSAYDELRQIMHVELVKGVPKVSQLRDGDLLLLDDLMKNVDECIPFFTIHSHHVPCSVIYLSQNMFAKGQRSLSLNAHYLTLFRSPRDTSQIKTLATQLESDNSKLVTDARMV